MFQEILGPEIGEESRWAKTIAPLGASVERALSALLTRVEEREQRPPLDRKGQFPTELFQRSQHTERFLVSMKIFTASPLGA